MSLTKSDLINSISNECGLSKDQSTYLIEYLLERMKSTLESGEDVLVSGFGKFCVKDKNERRPGWPPKIPHLWPLQNTPPK